jgi:hypothetical protein
LHNPSTARVAFQKVEHNNVLALRVADVCWHTIKSIFFQNASQVLQSEKMFSIWLGGTCLTSKLLCVQIDGLLLLADVAV